jgi:phosphatidylglycerophosphatase A
VKESVEVVLMILEPWTPIFYATSPSSLSHGFSPLVPGTMGTLVAIPVELVLSSLRFPFYELALIAFFFLSMWISDRAQNHWGRKDDRRIVIDEMMGYFLTMLWIPNTGFYILMGFFLFRVFDIVKPPPIRRMERFRGGLGIVLDDVVAGIYSNIILQMISYFTLSLGGRGMG